MSAKELPFAGIKVLDLTHARAGPTSVRLLSDWGADTIKIAQPEATSTLLKQLLPAPNYRFLFLRRNVETWYR